MSRGSSTGTSAAFAVVLGSRDLEQPADVGLPALAVVAALLVHRVGAPGSERIRQQVEHLPVEVALVADEGCDRLGRVAHEQALAHLGIPEAIAVGLHIAERQKGGEQRVRPEWVETEAFRQFVRGRRRVLERVEDAEHRRRSSRRGPPPGQ